MMPLKLEWKHHQTPTYRTTEIRILRRITLCEGRIRNEDIRNIREVQDGPGPGPGDEYEEIV